MTRFFTIALAALLLVQSTVAQTGVFSYDNPSYFPNVCKKQGQLSIMYTDGPSRYTADLLSNLKGVVDTKNLNFFVVTGFLKDVTSNVPLQTAANGGATIGLRWSTQLNLATATDAQVISQLQSDCETIASYTKKYVKYIFLPRDQVNEAKYKLIVSQGYVPVAYNLDSNDFVLSTVTDANTCINTITKTYSDTLSQLPNGQAYYIAVQRDLFSCTATSAPAVVQTIQKYGYSIVDLATCLGDASPYRSSCTAAASSSPSTSGSSPAPAAAPPSSSTTTTSTSGSTSAPASATTAARSSVDIVMPSMSAVIVALVSIAMVFARL